MQYDCISSIIYLISKNVSPLGFIRFEFETISCLTNKERAKKEIGVLRINDKVCALFHRHRSIRLFYIKCPTIYLYLFIIIVLVLASKNIYKYSINIKKKTCLFQMYRRHRKYTYYLKRELGTMYHEIKLNTSKLT